MPKVIGIDLGTTNSCMAFIEAGQPVVIPNREGGRTTPSIVAFNDQGDRLVGNLAKRQAVTNPTNTIYAVKRLIGKKFNDQTVESARKILPYTITEAHNGDVRLKIRDKEYSPQEISAFILADLKRSAEEFFGEEVHEAVITVPAYFSDPQRQATKDAGRIAGLEVLRIINEPTAACIAFNLEEAKSKTVAVFDLGGGTFDISILRVGEGLFEVIATAGDTYLGGEDMDNAIVAELMKQFEQEKGISLSQDRLALQRLKEAAEKAKCELSAMATTEVNLPFIAADPTGPKHLQTQMARADLEKMIAEIVARTKHPCEEALKIAGIHPRDIDEVLLVGGQTRTPMVIQTVKDIFGKEPRRDKNPDEVVALGAALQAGIIKGDVKEIVLLDAIPLSLGVTAKGNLFVKIIERGSAIPTKKGRIFTTVADNQDTVEIHVLQGEREVASENISLGKFDLIPGFYAYVGSAFGAGGLRARLGHHLAATAEPHWHIDYLLQVAHPVEVWYTTADRKLEHHWAELLEAAPRFRVPIPRFGASDYHRSRRSHLFYSKQRPSFRWFHQQIMERFEGVEVEPFLVEVLVLP